MKPRKPLKRSEKRIPRYARLQSSRTPIAKQRADPKKRRFATHRVKAFTDWIKTLPCSATGRSGGLWVVDPAHIKSRATGGGDLYNTLPLSRIAHELQHAIGWPAFEKRYGIDAKQIARDLTEQWFATEDGQAHQEKP